MEDRIAPALVKSSGLAQSSKISQVLWTHLLSFRKTGYLFVMHFFFCTVTDFTVKENKVGVAGVFNCSISVVKYDAQSSDKTNPL